MSQFEGLAATVNEAYQALTEATCVEDVYDILDFLSEEVRHYYPHIGCHNGCDLCCTQLYQPQVTASEWELILYYIRELPEIVQEEIVRRAHWQSQQYRDALLLQHTLINEPEELDTSDFEGTLKTLGRAFRDHSCPFLVQHRCGIYPVRPAKCRAQGSSLFTSGDEVRINTCLPEVSKHERYMTEQGTRTMTMPLYNVFEKVIALLNPENSLRASLAVWLITHVRNNQLMDQVDPNPPLAL